MFYWCCAEQPPTSAKVEPGSEVQDAKADEDTLLEVEEDDGKVSVTALPVLEQSVEEREEADFLPRKLEPEGASRVGSKEVSFEAREPKELPKSEGTFVEGAPAQQATEEQRQAFKRAIGRRTRLSLDAEHSRWRLSKDEIIMKKQLSYTLKSTLYLAAWKGTEVVMKCVQIQEEVGAREPSKQQVHSASSDPTASRPVQGNEVNEDLLEELLHEIELLSSLRHPDLVLFIGACLDKDAPVMCITEYMPGGDLERYYMARRNEHQTDRWRPPLTRILDWCSAVARALSFLHSRSEPIVHRDLKPLNLLLTKHLEVKVADLGISKMMAAVASDQYNMTGGVGSWLYMAPEVVRHKHYNEKVDIYAFALIMYFLSAGRAPFHQIGKDPELVLKEYVKGNEPRPTASDCHLQLRPVMIQAWNADASERPSAQEMVDILREVSDSYVPPSCLCARV
ncbi:unnamed protein product [Effrenium voratum]|uniref:Protein kinase domain-containing protein n=1 Tax=Effrenium voratum TaxID=2562239 RepID=A0AA36HRT4_9DINO|nr:unnamed protein product [Effrenium voratum]